MDNFIILISSSEEEREERNESKEGSNKFERPLRSKRDEYRDISDLTGLENVKAMIEAEALMKARRKNNINKRRKRRRRKIDVISQEELAIGAAKEELHQSRNEDDGETVEEAESDLIKLSETDLTLNLGHSAKKEDAGGIVAMDATERIREIDGIDPVEVIDCCSSSSEGNETVTDISLCRGVEYVTKGANIKKKRKRRNRRRRKKMKMTTADDMVVVSQIIRHQAALNKNKRNHASSAGALSTYGSAANRARIALQGREQTTSSIFFQRQNKNATSVVISA